MRRNTTEAKARRNNIITVIFCLVVVVFSAAAIFLSAYDWHTDSILGSGNVGTNHTELEGTIPLAQKKADWDYFDDTVFVGDSITYGIALYNHLSFNHVFAKVGLSQSTALYTKCVYTSKTTSYTIEDALEMAKPGKVILTIGINAIYNYKSDAFYKDYLRLIEKIKKATPESVIIIQSILPVTAKWAQKNGKPNCNEFIIYANQKLYEMAQEQDCLFLHTFSDLCDEQGFLLPEYSGDGIHLSTPGYEKMFDHILSRPVKSSGAFTKIGAVRPPVIVNPNSSTVSMPDLNVQSSISQNDKPSTGTESSIAQDEPTVLPETPTTSDLSGSDIADGEANVNSDIPVEDETEEKPEQTGTSTSSQGKRPQQNRPNQNQNASPTKPSQNNNFGQ